MDGTTEAFPIDVLSPELIVVSLLGMLLFGLGCAAAIFLFIRVLAAPPDWRTRMQALHARGWSVSEAGVLLGAAMVVMAGFTCGVALAGVNGSTRPELLRGLTVMQTLLFQGTIIAVVLLLRWRRRSTWSHGFGTAAMPLRRAMLQAVLFYLAAVPFLVVTTLLYRALLSALQYPVAPQQALAVFSDPAQPAWIRIYLAGLAILTAPIVEELLFRGVLLPAASRRLGFLPALGVVSLIFALIHFHVPSIAPLFVIAMAFSVAYLYSGTIIVPMLMHAMFNLVSIALFLLASRIPGFQLAHALIERTLQLAIP